MISYFNTLITRIQTIDGYDSEYNVVYINEFKKKELYTNSIHAKYFDDININPYRGNSLINDYAWKRAMAFWCGYSPELGDENDYKNKTIVKQMPNYPDDGSIIVIDNTIIVKFSDD